VNQRRIVLAVFLMFIVALLPGLLFKPKVTNRPAIGSRDSTVHAPAPTAVSGRDSTVQGVVETPPPRPSAALPAETVWVTSPLYRFGFTTRGARMVAAELAQYVSFAQADTQALANLIPAGHPMLGSRLVLGTDTVSLSDLAYTANRQANSVTFTATLGSGSVTLSYHFVPDDYHLSVSGKIEGLGGTGAVLLVDLGQGLRSVDAEPLADYREFAVVTKADKTQKTTFASLDPGERAVLDGPFEWVAVKSKYFFAAVLAPEQKARPFAGAIAVGQTRDSVAVAGLFGTRRTPLATRAAVTTTIAVPPAGDFRYDVYVGPFEHRRLDRLGHGLDDANPYGWSIFRPIIHPVSLVVVRILFWMHERLHLAYGWVLVIFGVLIRMLLWPLQQKAMESQMRMQAVQPLMTDIQARYKSDPAKLQQEMLKLYREHKINPLGGCLPMLLPMPVLLALFFVFSNTIEFRGVPFLWLPDLARHDPLYIIPVVMGVSMFAVSKLGQRGLPPNPQTKMLLYFMPAMLTFVFLRLASGLNLYYAVQNLISLPQQYLISQRRLAAQAKR
jgi:YidC/Oxa1 family membrane protein insertase